VLSTTSTLDFAPPREAFGSLLAAPPLKRILISDATIGVL
jgi:hypothetical protein